MGASRSQPIPSLSSSNLLKTNQGLLPLKEWGVDTSPFLTKQLEWSSTLFECKLSIAVSRGKRISMQDQLFVWENQFFPSHSLYGDDTFSLFLLCDGHGEKGDRIAASACGEFANAFSSHFCDQTTPIKALQIALSDVNRLFQNLQITHTSGTCMTAALFHHQKHSFYLMQLGDSKTVIWNIENNTIKQSFETPEHNSFNEKERIRVSHYTHPSTGRKPTWNKHGTHLESIICVTRSLGNQHIDWCMGREPDIFQLKQENGIMVMASDGLWTLLSNEEAETILKQNPTSLALLQETFKKQQILSDNTSIITFIWKKK